MAARLAPDGSIVFESQTDRLLREAAASFTKSAIEILTKPNKFEEYLKIAQLRESCGVKNPPLKIRKPEDYHG